MYATARWHRTWTMEPFPAISSSNFTYRVTVTNSSGDFVQHGNCSSCQKKRSQGQFSLMAFAALLGAQGLHVFGHSYLMECL